MKIAKFKLFEGRTRVGDWDDFMEADKDYVRMSEVMEVEFVDLPPEMTIPPQIERIDAGIAELRAEVANKIAHLEDKKSKLLAITHQPDQGPE